MVTFESAFDIGEKVQHYITKEKFYVRFITFGLSGCVYQCYTTYSIGKTHELYNFDEEELELVNEDI